MQNSGEPIRYKKILVSRYKLLLKEIGVLIMFIGAFLLTPLFVLPFYPQDIPYYPAFVKPSILYFIIGFCLWKIIKRRAEVTLTLKEGGIIVLVSWILAIIGSAIPFMLADKLNFTQAIFESTSGWTTTGLTVMDESQTPHIFLMWRSIMQFFGGAGLVVVMLSSVLHPYGFGLYRAEGRSDKLLPHIKKSTKLIMYIYSGFAISGVIMYLIAGMGLFDAINHSMTALSTGGFSTKPGSIGHWNSLPIELVTYILMIMGTTNFATHFVLLRGKVKTYLRNSEVRLMFFLFALFIPLIGFLTLNEIYPSLPGVFRRSVFEVITAISTTGFSLDTFTNWNLFGTFAIIIMMLIGGGTGSTAGGIKLYRIHLMSKSIWWELKSYFYPRGAVIENSILRGDHKIYIKNDYIREAGNYIFLYLMTYFIGVLIFLAHDYGLAESMFEFASALGTVGLSIGITGPEAPSTILWTESIGMLLGRLEFLVIFYAIVKIIRDTKYMITK